MYVWGQVRTQGPIDITPQAVYQAVVFRSGDVFALFRCADAAPVGNAFVKVVPDGGSGQRAARVGTEGEHAGLILLGNQSQQVPFQDLLDREYKLVYQ